MKVKKYQFHFSLFRIFKLRLALLIFNLLFFIFSLNAQTYTIIPADSIVPDYSNAKAFTLSVSSLDSAFLNTNFGLKTVCVDIVHPRLSDLGLTLVSPDGTQIDLSSGASGANYHNTCFDMAAGTTILSGTAPYTGLYYPRHNIGNFNNGQTGAGVWRLFVQDVALNDTGYVKSIALTFGTNPPLPSGSPLGSCTVFSPQGCTCADSTQTNCALLPDMFVGYSWFAGSFHREEFHDSLRVSNSTANAGFGPMEIIGTGQWFCGDSLVSGSVLCPNGKYSKQLVKQRIYVKTNNGYFDFIDTVVGTMTFHAELGHRHLHVDEWTENTLRIRGPESDPAKWPILGKGDKASVNLYDHVKCDNLFNACDFENKVVTDSDLKNAGLGLGYVSGSANVQGISVGYSDIYENNLIGQAIYFDSLCNGDYYMVAQFDPQHRFVDGNRANDVTIAPITLSLQKANCCKAKFEVDTINFSLGSFRFIDRSVAMPNSWKWNFGDGTTDTIQFPAHQYVHSGNYTIKLYTTTAQGCKDSFQFSIATTFNTSIAETIMESDISVFPNPSNGLFNLKINLPQEQSISMEVFNLLGEKIQTVATQKLLLVGENNLSFSIAEKGVFVLVVKNNQRTFYRKIVCQ